MKKKKFKDIKSKQTLYALKELDFVTVNDGRFLACSLVGSYYITDPLWISSLLTDKRKGWFYSLNDLIPNPKTKFYRNYEECVIACHKHYEKQVLKKKFLVKI